MSFTINGVEPSSIIVKRVNKETGEEISSTELSTVMCNTKEVWGAQGGGLIAFDRNRGDNIGRGFFYSDDGVNWRNTFNLTNKNFCSISYLNNTYIALVDGVCYSSSNGIEWLQKGKINVTSNALQFVSFKKGNYIIYDADGIYVTQDLITLNKVFSYTQYTSSTFFIINIVEINNTLITLNRVDDVFTIYTSVDGVQWEAKKTFGIDKYKVGVSKANDKVFIGGYYTYDGINFIETDESCKNCAISYARGIYISLDLSSKSYTSGTLYTSKDGIVWTVKLTGLVGGYQDTDGARSVQGFFYDKISNQYTIVTFDDYSSPLIGSAVYYNIISEDGENWTALKDYDVPKSYAIKSSFGNVVIVSSNYTFYTGLYYKNKENPEWTLSSSLGNVNFVIYNKKYGYGHFVED